MSFNPTTGEVTGEPNPRDCPRCREEHARAETIKVDLEFAENALRKERRIVSALQTQLRKLTEESPEGRVAKALFRYWLLRCEKNAKRTKFGEARVKKVIARLHDNYEPSFVARAIDGAAVYAYINPDTGLKYDDLTTICRDESNLERFHTLAETMNVPTLLGPAWLKEFEPKPMTDASSDEPF